MTQLMQRAVMFLDMAKGGWLQGYEILDGDKVIGTKSVGAETRRSEAKACYRLGDQEFATAAEFAAAYEAKKRDAEWEAAAPLSARGGAV